MPRVNTHQRGLFLSAARSEIFNHILAERVRQGNWNTPLDGDVFMFSDSQSFFTAEALDEDIQCRVRDKAIHPSGVLWGKQPSTATGAALAIEDRIADTLSEFAAGLASADMETSRRPLRLCPDNLTWNLENPGTLQLNFVLPSGAYATTVLRELVTMTDFEG
jgi:tRNA pseudouridine13 synthase